MTLQLRPYQKAAVEWIKPKKRALLALDMRLGKTAVTIQAAKELGFKKILIVCPSIARITWEREFKKWGSTLKTRVLTKRVETPFTHDEVVICSFDYTTQRFNNLKETKWDLLVVDESHYLKSVTAKRTSAVLSAQGLIHSTSRTWFLTGTPMPNHPFEMWPMLYTFGATKLTQDQFIAKFCTWYDFNGRKVVNGTNIRAIAELKEIMAPIMLRQKIGDVISDLPEVQIEELEVEGSLKELPDELKEQFRKLSETMDTAGYYDADQQIKMLELVASSVSSLRRYCAIQKVEAITELVAEELNNKTYDKIIIFAVHREAVETLTKNLIQFNPAVVHGGISPALRQRNIDAFQNDPSCRVFIGNIQAANTNIDLSKANQVLFLEQSWVPGDNAQAIARAISMTKRNSIYVRVASLADTIDEKVQEILLRKTREIAALFNTAKKE